MARPKILVFQHVPYEPLGTLDPLLKEAGFRIRYVNFGREPKVRPALDKYAALIVLGGPMNSDQIETYPNLITEVDIIREAIDRDMSVLGICLGAQLLAKALGGSVSRNAVREIGWYDVNLTAEGVADPVLSTFAERQEVFQWHEDGIELPPGTVHLASSPASNVQAFRYGEHAYGFQFHLEVDSSLIERWLTVHDNQAVLDDERHNIDPTAICAQTDGSIDALQNLSRQTFSRWIDRFEIAPRRRRLLSR
ncbi:MAG: type 1 glutamine amidotransferase [Gammaproteobacteria bacterium]|nr:type 1 glutamine amidotransferase [Gammaproteobacteria bacterium]MDH3750425.1 type 1 glutamine amidotransferase [Gammaproteobacteria bacterium]MDH3805929.1 type 1 glutamine amidotransferase [Gammaproteobacteria bacterium]